ncbi:hypothetical protein VSS93_27755 [Pseudomonas syringae pv. tagetis]
MFWFDWCGWVLVVVVVFVVFVGVGVWCFCVCFGGVVFFCVLCLLWVGFVRLFVFLSFSFLQ